MLSASQVKAAVAILFSNKFHGVHLHMKPYTHDGHRETEGERARETHTHSHTQPITLNTIINFNRTNI